MRFALINSGLGLLAAASKLHQLRPDADLVLAMDPDGMPWGPRDPSDIAARSLRLARIAAGYQPDVIVMACNSGSVHGLDVLRAEFEPAIPVVGTVPAIKPAAAAVHSVAIWATEATTGSQYQKRLISDFGGSAEVTAVACPGLATAVDAGDERATKAAVAAAAARTPQGCEAIVLGCTEYELAAGLIMKSLPAARLFGSAAAVATQALRRITAESPGRYPAAAGSGGTAGDPAAGTATLLVLLSGRPAGLPAAALRYPEGRTLARLAAGRHPARSQLSGSHS